VITVLAAHPVTVNAILYVGNSSCTCTLRLSFYSRLSLLFFTGVLNGSRKLFIFVKEFIYDTIAIAQGCQKQGY